MKADRHLAALNGTSLCGPLTGNAQLLPLVAHPDQFTSDIDLDSKPSIKILHIYYR